MNATQGLSQSEKAILGFYASKDGNFAQTAVDIHLRYKKYGLGRD